MCAIFPDNLFSKFVRSFSRVMFDIIQMLTKICNLSLCEPCVIEGKTEKNFHFGFSSNSRGYHYQLHSTLDMNVSYEQNRCLNFVLVKVE